MSLPVELRRWLCCPGCGSALGLKRLGRVGVKPSEYGKRKRTKDSNRIVCTLCGHKFRSRDGTMLENMGYDPHQEVPF
jgi:hypothetical protein